MTRVNEDHLIVHQQGLVVACTACGEQASVELPTHFDTWLRMARRFRREHRDCAQRKEISR